MDGLTMVMSERYGTGELSKRMCEEFARPKEGCSCDGKKKGSPNGKTASVSKKMRKWQKELKLLGTDVVPFVRVPR
jgi:hypothetical protein